jgi:hypothetical protein
MPADLLVARGGMNVIVEVKDGAKTPGARRLTSAEALFLRKWHHSGWFCVIDNVDDAIFLVDEMRKGHSATTRACVTLMNKHFQDCYTRKSLKKLGLVVVEAQFAEWGLRE